LIGLVHARGMEDTQVGLVLRAVRIRRGFRQADVARMAGISQALVSRVERGDMERATVRSVRRIAAAIGVSVPFAPRWRGAESPKLLDERHASLVHEVAARLKSLGWAVRPELTFAAGRETGSVDILAWVPKRRAVLVVEVKSLVADLQDTLAAPSLS
jgi:transcriptional regulator with XRE-family HTH domain